MRSGTLCLVDANSLVYRAFYAIKASLLTKNGQPTNAVYGFIKMMGRIGQQVRPTHQAVCFDVGRVTHRTERFSAYKMQRPSMPPELVVQLPWIRQVAEAYRWAVLDAQGFEADDVIATLTRRFRDEFEQIVIVSSDKDILQLVEGNVRVFNPYKEDGIFFDREKVKEQFGVEPVQILDLIALMGDASDNIPGVKGIGEKTARQLVRDFGSVETMMKEPHRVGSSRIQTMIKDQEEMIRVSRDLATLRLDTPVDTDKESLRVLEADIEKLRELFSHLEFRSLLKSLPAPLVDSHQAGLRRQPGCCEDIFSRVGPRAAVAVFVRAQDQGVILEVAIDEGNVYSFQDQQEMKKLLSSPDVTVMGYDIKKIRHELKRQGIDITCRVFDVMIAAHLVDSIRSQSSLEELVEVFLEHKPVHPSQMEGCECSVVLRLGFVLGPMLESRGMVSLFNDVEMPLCGILFEMEETGVRIDETALRDLDEDVAAKLRRLEEEIFAHAGSSFNLNSPKQLAEVLFGRLKCPVIKRTKTGFSTDEEVLKKLSAEHAVARLILEYRQLAKLKSTYIDALPKLQDPLTHRIHSSFNQTVTETGRLSSSNPNLQNIPVKTEIGRRIRQAFVPGEGYDVILSADYSQIELRILAHLSGDPVLIRAFQEGADIHRRTAALIFGVPEGDVTDDMRDNAKRVNFGIVYGISAFGLSKDLGIDVNAAQAFIAEYFLRYPKVKEFLDSQMASARANGFVTTILGRRRMIPEINNPNIALRQFAERQAINAPIQGSAADVIKVAMVNVAGELKQLGLRARLLMQVHDELVFESSSQDVKPLAALVRRAMETAVSLNVELLSKIYVGPNWLDAQEID